MSYVPTKIKCIALRNMVALSPICMPTENPIKVFFFPYYRARDNINLDLAAVADLFQPLNAYFYGSINKIIGITII